MDKIKQQSNRVGELIFSADTGATYQKTLTLTWNILRETGVLLWLTICLVFVGAEWFWNFSIDLGLKARAWYESTKEPKAEEPKSATEIGQSVLSALGTGTETLLYQAKQQLGIDADAPAPKAPTPTAKTNSPVATASAAPPTPAPPAAEATKAEPTTLKKDEL
ncbi:MAG: hypothetical protein AAFY20_26610 [Cyanobacteria bacterium J06639_14]